MTMKDRALMTGGQRRLGRSEGSRSPTPSPHRPVSATIGRRGAQRVLVGLPASESVPRHVSSRYGCGPGKRLSSAHLLGAWTVPLADDRIRR
jgi:hypothetical protein